jgi:hypothetical protein
VKEYGSQAEIMVFPKMRLTDIRMNKPVTTTASPFLAFWGISRGESFFTRKNAIAEKNIPKITNTPNASSMGNAGDLAA